jgi:hypothetical protein
MFPVRVPVLEITPVIAVFDHDEIVKVLPFTVTLPVVVVKLDPLIVILSPALAAVTPLAIVLEQVVAVKSTEEIEGGAAA